MAKKKTPKKKPAAKKIGGPFLASAVICESILDGPDSIVSAIKIIDTVRIWIPPDAPPELLSGKQPIRITQNALVIFKTGDARGNHTLQMTVHAPDGKKTNVADRPVKFTKDAHGGANVKVQLNMTVNRGGVYWFDVKLDGKLYTRMPLNVEINRLTKTRQ